MRRFLPLLALPAALLAGCATPRTTPGTTTTNSAVSPATTSPGISDPAISGSDTTEPAAPGPAATTKPRVTPVTSGTSRCHTGDLKVAVVYGDGATGRYSLNLRFTNKSSHTCTLYGYPGVSWVAGDNGTQVNDPFKRVGGTKKTITIKPGATAHSMLLEGQYAFVDEKTCKPVQVRGYRVYPPGETAAVFVNAPEKVCSAKGVNVGVVNPVTTGPGESAG